MRLGLGTDISVGYRQPLFGAFRPFTMTVTTSDTMTIPTTGAGYDFDIDWGDGTVETITGTAPTTTHTYSSAGTYQIKIYRDFPQIYFNNGGDKLKVDSIDQWGDIAWTSMEAAFFGCSNMDVTATDVPDLSPVSITCLNMFRSCSSLVGNASFNNWDVSSVTNMSSMFSGATSFNQNIGSWDVSSVTNMGAMFNIASSFNQDIGSWDVSSVMGMSFMFFNADGMSSANLGAVKNWNVSSLTSATDFMANCTNSMSTADYDELLQNWEALPPQNNVAIHFNNAKYSISGTAVAARTSLTTATPTGYGWTITDGGGI